MVRRDLDCLDSADRVRGAPGEFRPVSSAQTVLSKRQEFRKKERRKVVYFKDGVNYYILLLSFFLQQTFVMSS